MAAVNLIAITSVFLHGRIIAPGKEFACEMEHAKKLVKGGSAKLKDMKNAHNSAENNQNNGLNNNGNSGGNDQNSGEKKPENEEFQAELAKKLEGLTVPKLKELAEKHKIALKEGSKPEIIKQIVDSGVITNETDI